MYNHLSSYCVTDQEIKMAEGFLGESIVSDLKKKVKDDIFLTNEVLSDAVHGSITVCCINYPKEFKSRSYSLSNNYKLSQYEYVDDIMKYYNNPHFIALKKDIVKYYDISVSKHEQDSNIILIGHIDIQTIRLPDIYEVGGLWEGQQARYLKSERKHYYISLLRDIYDKAVDEMDQSKVCAIESVKLENYNSEDFI